MSLRQRLRRLRPTPRPSSGTDPVVAARLIYGGSWESKVGVSGGIPTYGTRSGSLMGTTSTAAQINTAIANAANDTYVELDAGTFTLTEAIVIENDRVELRGQVDANGVPTTVLNWSAIPGDSCLYVGAAAGWDTDNAGNWTTINVSSGCARGATTVTLASAPGAISGRLMWFTAASGGSVTGQGFSDFWNSSSGRCASQCVKVTSVSGSDVTFSPAVDADYWTGTIQVSFRAAANQISKSGIRNLSLTHSGGSGHYVRMIGSDECWAQNIKTYSVDAGCYHYYVYTSFRAEIRHCNVSHMTNLTNSTYCMVTQQSSNLLIEDNWFHDCPNVMPMFGMNGSAFAYNYINDLPYDPPEWLSQIVFFHGSHNAYNLFEGNWCAAMYHDDANPGSMNTTVFRQRWRGYDATGPKTSNINCLTIESLGSGAHTNMTVAGCVMGENGVHTQYNGDIFVIDSATDDATLDRIKNYNYVNDAVPAGEALSAGEALVTSYLHSSKPSWFSSLPWPWCDPDNPTQSNTATNLPAGYRAANGVDP